MKTSLLLASCFAAAAALGGDFKVSSPDFKDAGTIPAKFAMAKVPGGENLSPALEWAGKPEGTQFFVVTAIDHHSMARRWVHWMVLNLPADSSGLKRAAASGALPQGAEQLDNSFGANGYGGPQPPRGSGPHEYVFTVYALKAKVDAKGADFLSEAQLLKLMRGKTLGSASCHGFLQL